MSNVLLVSAGDASAGGPVGVAPDLGREIGAALGVPVELVPYPHPDKLCASAGSGEWDVCLVGADPARAGAIEFTDAYCEIEATLMVPSASTVRGLADLDQPGRRIASKKGGAYDLWLARNIKHAELVQAETLDASYDAFHAGGLDALSGLRPKLSADLGKNPGLYRLLDGKFMAVQQSIGCVRPSQAEDGSPLAAASAGADWLSRFALDARAGGLVQRLLDRHGVTGKLSVPPVPAMPPRGSAL